jgi:uncharacterized protein (TIGR02001 family)
MKKTLFALSALAALSSLPNAAFADVTFNVGAVTDYRYRGMSQSNLQPALQGGADWAQGETGFYIGTWGSTIQWVQEAGGSGDVEIDIYGGYKGKINADLGYDVGLLQYWYPGNNLPTKAETTEIYGALTFGPATLKYSHSLTNTFANPDSKNSGYLDLSATFDIQGVSVVPHVGYQKIAGPNSDPGSYWDMALTISKDFNGFVPSLSFIATRSVDGAFYTSPASGKYLGSATVVLGAKFNF